MKKIEKIQKNGEAVNALKLDFYTQQQCGDYYYMHHNWPLETSFNIHKDACLLYTSPSPRDADQSRMPSSA